MPGFNELVTCAHLVFTSVAFVAFFYTQSLQAIGSSLGNEVTETVKRHANATATSNALLNNIHNAINVCSISVCLCIILGIVVVLVMVPEAAPAKTDVKLVITRDSPKDSASKEATREACLQAFNKTFMVLVDGKLCFETDNEAQKEFFSFVYVNPVQRFSATAGFGGICESYRRYSAFAPNASAKIALPHHVRGTLTVTLDAAEHGALLLSPANNENIFYFVVSHSPHFTGRDMVASLNEKFKNLDKKNERVIVDRHLCCCVPEVEAEKKD